MERFPIFQKDRRLDNSTRARARGGRTRPCPARGIPRAREGQRLTKSVDAMLTVSASEIAALCR